MNISAHGHYEPSLDLAFLPGCRCGAPHPLAMKRKPLNTEHCPDCGERVAGPGATVSVPATITGHDPILNLGGLFLRIGKALALFAKRL